MSRSREIALRCAAALPHDLLIGRPEDDRREAYVERFGVTCVKVRRLLTHPFMDQLDRCKDDSARRLLLGVGEKFEARQDLPAMYVKRERKPVEREKNVRKLVELAFRRPVAQAQGKVA